MIATHRHRFNRDFAPERYARFLRLLEDRFGEAAPFRHSETPCFLPRELIDRMARYGVEMVEQLLADPRYMEESRQGIPEAYCAPNETATPLFVQADFGLDRDLNPKLVEIQGFPSLYAYQPAMAQAYREAYGIDDALEALPAGLSLSEYHALLGRAIVGGHAPENVILLEIDPWRQKTRHDFVMTEKLFGVHAVDLREVRKQGRRLYYPREGRLVPVARIYNRAIADELERRGIQAPFDFRDDLDLEWAGHPNWFFRLSKFSLPYLKHEAVPRAEFLHRAAGIDHPERYVLKPLFSFAGAGVIVGPTAEQIAAIPADRRGGYILQERVDFHPVIDTPAGPAKIEVRIMYIWLETPRPVNVLIRMGRGAQMGVDFNRGMEWVGASAAFLDGTEAR